MTQCWHNKYAQQATATQCTVMPQIVVYFNDVVSDMHLTSVSKVEHKKIA